MKNKIYIAVIVILTISTLSLWVQKRDLYFSQLYEDVVPHVKLTSAMGFYGIDVYQGQVLTSQNKGDIAIGKITGFVTFPKPSDQPKGAWQYYTIQATNEYDEAGNQLFLLQEVIKMRAVAPEPFDDEILRVTSNTDQSVTLESESGQSFKINKKTDEVTVIDADGGITSLQTDDSEYRDFMLEFLKKK